MRGRGGDYEREGVTEREGGGVTMRGVQSLLWGICNTDKGQQQLPMVTNK